MKALFLAVLVSGLFYFLAVRRGLDFYTLGFVSSALYFTPGIAGFDILEDPIEPKTYAVFILVLSSILVAGALRPPRALQPVREPYGHAPWIAAALTGLVVLYVLGTNGPAALFLPKSDQDIATGAYVVWRVMASLAALYGVMTGKRGVLLCGLGGLLLMFLASDRTAVAMFAAAVGVEIVGRRGALPPLRAARGFILPLLVAGVLVWGGKLMHIAIRESFRQGDFSSLANLASDPRAVYFLTTRAEPFLTQAHLNQAVRRDLYVGPRHLVGVAYQLWPAPSMFGYPSNAFNDIIQAELFPQAKKNTLAYNYWAEGLVSGGWLLLVLFIAIFLAGIEAANAAARSPRVGWRGVGLLMGAYWAVYIQRNSLASIIAYEKQILVLGLIVLVGAALLPGGGRVRAALRTAPAPRSPAPAPQPQA